MKRTVVGIVLMSVVIGTSGCGMASKDYASIPLEEALTTQEVLDYYAKELSYESIAQYNNINNTRIEFNDIAGEMKEKAIAAYKNVIKDYKTTKDYKMSKGNHEYLKAFIDDMVISESEVKGVKEAMGFYYVEVDFNTSENRSGKFKPEANYLGINGLIIEDYTGNTVIDDSYMKVAIDEVNKYRQANKMPLLDVKDTGEDSQINDNQVGLGLDKKANNVRKLNYRVREFNQVVGSSKEQIAFMPDINLVFNPTSESGSANGYGIFESGKYGLSDFGYKRGNNGGKLTVTFVFKQNELEHSALDYQFCYINSYVNNNTIENIGDVTIPSFVKEELDIIVERLDRATCNRDISALMSNEIVEDAGLGMLYGLYGANAQIVSFVSNVNKVLARDNNVYLVELERTIEDCAKGTGVTAVYKDIYYAVIRQTDLDFKINDIVLMSRELVRNPEPNPDAATYRRLVALNLAGPISATTQGKIKETLGSLYQASTDRILDGMYGAFNTNKELLSEERLEYLNSRLRGYLIAKGINQPAVMTGKVTTWIGGYDTQAELTTEELIEYTGTDTGIRLECYYLMSNYGTKWVIDDITIIAEEEVSGDELTALRNRLSN